MFNLKSTKAFVAGVIALAIAIPALVMAQAGFGQPQIGSVIGRVNVLPNVRVIDFGKVIYTGRMDVNPTIDRIRAGKKLNHNNDGSIFTNVQKQLPVSTDSQYYREFVHQMNGFPFPGPQRVVIGKRGEVFYTGDHYSTFFRVR
jgi:filamentous hemagglutinin